MVLPINKFSETFSCTKMLWKLLFELTPHYACVKPQSQSPEISLICVSWHSIFSDKVDLFKQQVFLFTQYTHTSNTCKKSYWKTWNITNTYVPPPVRVPQVENRWYRQHLYKTHSYVIAKTGLIHSKKSVF